MPLLNLTSLFDIQPAKVAPQQGLPIGTETSQQAGQIIYWKKKLSGKLPVIAWPGYRRKAKSTTYIKQQYSFTIPLALKQALQVHAADIGVDLPLIAVTAFQTLLFRYCRQEDIILGMQVKGTEQFSSNIIPLRLHPEENLSFRQTLNNTQQTVAEAYTKGNIPYGALVLAINPKKFITQASIFQILFQWKNKPDTASTAEPANDIYQKIEEGSIYCLDLTLELINEADSLRAVFHYNAHLFDIAAVIRMATHLQMLLQAAVEDDKQITDLLPMLSSAEQKQLLSDFNHSEFESLPQCAHHLFEQQVIKDPNAVAVIFDGQPFTYNEINEKANQLAHYLKKLQVGPEKVVGLCLNRSPQMLIGMLGILKAGGAFMPIDPELPTHRLQFLIEDAKPVLLLTQKGLINLAELTKQIPQLFIDQDWPAIAKESTVNIKQSNDPSQLMYVIYTSGSSGKPKGVLVEHSSLSSFLKAYKQLIHLTPNDRVLQFVPVVFDPMVEDVFCTFDAGATLVLRTDEMMESVGMFLAKCREWKVTILNLPVAYWHMMAEELREPSLQLPECVRLIKVGGERLLPEKVHAWQSRFGKFPKLMNAYGPTETTIAATIYDCTDFNFPTSEVPIGFPLANTQAYVLDPYLQPVPLGFIGELYLGGNALARGYLNRDELTTDKFILNPFSHKPGARMYRTGDMVRWLPDGKLEYHGRVDNQVKIRGFRIELEEIESALMQHPQVKQAVVIVSEKTNGEKQLIAYVVTEFSVLEVAILRNHLKQRLPEYMIPSLFVSLDKIPLTFNGKTDRKALPSPNCSIQLTATYQAPQTQEEQLLADIWARVLSVKEVSIHDNFFEIGGHSLLAARLTAEVKQATGYTLPLSWIFAHPTIKEQASYLASPPDTKTPDTLIRIQAGETKAPIYLVHDGFGGIEYGYQVSKFIDKSRPVYGFQAIGLDSLENSQQSVEKLAASYVERILLHQPNGDYCIGGYSGGAAIAYEIACQLLAKGKEVGLLAIFDAYPMNLNKLTYQRIGVSYIVRNLINMYLSPEISPVEKLRAIFIGIPDIIYTNGMRIVLRRREKKAGATLSSSMKCFMALREMVDRYKFKPYPGNMLFVRALDNQVKYLRNSHFGWKRYARQVKVYDLPGNHNSLFSNQENAKAIAGILQEHLQENK